jgi:uracil-DNA glycosylase
MEQDGQHERGPERAGAASEPREECASLARALAAHLARRSAAGVERVQRPAQTAAFAPAQAPGGSPPAAAARAPTPAPRAASAELSETDQPHERFRVVTPPPPPAPAPEPAFAREIRARAAACTSLGELRALVAGCTACGLAETRTQTVFSDGRAPARILFVGEAPGQHEDERGVPFVGAAGELLTKIIEQGMGIPRSEVHIANVLKCRPPGNREPAPEEKALCTPYLDRQIELVDPEILVALGLHAARHLLRSTLSMGRLRGKIHLLNGRKVVATYHPAFLLRNPAAKKDCWQDIQLAMRAIGLEPPARARQTPAP